MSLYMHALSQFGSAVVRFLVNNHPSLLRLGQSSQLSLQPSPTIANVNINTLPEECLLPIFDRIPLSELLCLDQVCPRWAALLPSACKRRRTLVLLVGCTRVGEIEYDIPINNNFEATYHEKQGWFFNFPLAERDSVIVLPNLVPSSFEEFLLDDRQTKGFFDILYSNNNNNSASLGSGQEHLTEMARLNSARLTGQLVQYLVDLFPKVDTLVVMRYRCYEGDFRSVIDLLESSWSLITAKLWIYTWDIDKSYVDRPNQHPVGALLRSIDQQSSLEQLTLNILSNQNDPLQFQPFSFPIKSYSFIGRLKVAQLFISQYDPHNDLWHTVHRFASDKLTFLGLGNDADYFVNAVLRPNFRFATKVRHLYYYRHFERGVRQLNDLCQRFTSLTMLGLRWSQNITFTELVTNLASLPHLTYLNLYISFYEQPVNAFALEPTGGAVEGDQGGEVPRRISLPQVKILVLGICKRSHRDFESLSSHVFPSVEVIHVFESGTIRCSVCLPFHRIGWAVNHQQKVYCYRKMMRSFQSKLPVFSRLLHKERLRIVNLVLLYLSIQYCIYKSVI